MQEKTWRAFQALRHGENPHGYSLRGFDQRHCIFVHIPKCGGISVVRALFGNLGGGHATLAEYQQIFSPDEFRAYFKFAFVRNPWDRLVSAFLYLKAGGMNAFDRKWASTHLAAYPDVDSFVCGWLTSANARSWIHFRPQLDFLAVLTGDPGPDLVGRFETLAQDFAYVCRRLGVTAELHHLNRVAGREQDYRVYYTDRSRRIVAEVYHEDIAVLGYAF